jgi:Bacterial aa3 type cytochrome c oxidase subunit IV
MVQPASSSPNLYNPKMDAKTHEQTYSGFVLFTEVASAVVLCWLLALALAGLKGAWVTAGVGILLSFAAGAFGGLAPSISWRAPAAVAALLVVLFFVV